MILRLITLVPGPIASGYLAYSLSQGPRNDNNLRCVKIKMCFPINGGLQSWTAIITLYNAILTKVTSYHVLVTLATINLNNKKQNSVMQHYNFMRN